MAPSSIAVLAKRLIESCPDLQGYRLLSCDFAGQSLFPLYRCHLQGKGGSLLLALKIVDSQQMARTEFDGLKALSEAGAKVPQLYGLGSFEGTNALGMEFVEEMRTSSESLLECLKKLYSKEAPHFGWKEDNFIGSLPQPNGIYKNFSDYWLHSRIEAQLALAQRNRKLSDREAEKVVSFTKNIIEKFQLDESPPALIHGDLWSGNLLGDYLIDPSVSYGNPEQDLAMLRLFGSPLSLDQMEGLLAALGRPAGFSQRIGFWQVYPLLVHVNLFGGSYKQQLLSACRL